MQKKQPITRDSSTLEKLDELKKSLALLIIKGSERINNYRNKPVLKREKVLIESFEKEMEKKLLWCLNETQDLFNAYKNQETSKYKRKNNKQRF